MILNRLNLIIYIILFVIIVALSMLVHSLYKDVESAKSFESLYNIEHQQVQKFKDDAGHWRSRAQVAEVTKDNFDDLAELKNLSSEFKELKKSLKNLENYSQTSTVTTIHKTIKLKDTTIVTKDSVTIHGNTFQFKDRYEDIFGLVFNDSVVWTIKHTDSLEIVQYWDRKWFLGKKKYFNEIKSLNPNTEITYQKNLMAKRKRGLF